MVSGTSWLWDRTHIWSIVAHPPLKKQRGFSGCTFGRFGYHVIALCQCWVIYSWEHERRCSKFSKCLARVRGSLLKSASFFSYNGSANSCKAEAPVQSCSCTFLSNDKKKTKESTNIQYQNLPLDGLWVPMNAYERLWLWFWCLQSSLGGGLTIDGFKHAFPCRTLLLAVLGALSLYGISRRCWDSQATFLVQVSWFKKVWNVQSTWEYLDPTLGSFVWTWQVVSWRRGEFWGFQYLGGTWWAGAAPAAVPSFTGHMAHTAHTSRTWK